MKPKCLFSFFFFLTCDIQFSVYLTSFKQWNYLCILSQYVFLKLFVNLREPQPRPKYVALLNEIEFTCV